jgi:hypothetical protein
MEYLLVASIVGMGVMFQKNKKDIPDINKRPLKKVPRNQIPSSTNVYTSKRAYNIFQDEQKQANALFDKSLYPQDTNVVTPGPPYPIMYNKVDYADKTLPIEFDKYQKYDNILVDNLGDNSSPMPNKALSNKSIPETGGFNGISLTGNQIDPNNFTHNNMQPFFGGGVKQNLDEFSTRGTFETFTGTNDNYQNKQEQTPLFQPQKNMSNIYGAQNLDGYMLDRYYVSNIRSNESPIQQVYVGPGLNQGYTNEPSGGFQQADTRDYVLPKTTDESRVKTNPKISYYGRVNSGQKIAKPGKIGTVYKNQPDTFYVQQPDRYFTTTGQIIAPEQRPCIVTKYTNRKTTEMMSRKGSAAPTHGTVAQVRSKYKVSNKVTYKYDDPIDSNKAGQWSILDLFTGNSKDRNDDYGKKTIKLRNNKKLPSNNKNFVMNYQSQNKSTPARSTQKVKVPKKYGMIKNERETGNFNGSTKGVVYDPNDIARATIKETNIDNYYRSNVGVNTKGNVVYDPNDIARTTIKETNIDNNFRSNVAVNTKGNVVYDPNDTARTTIKETNIDNYYRSNVGVNTKGNVVFDPNDIARTTIKETNIDNNFRSNVGVNTKGNVVYDPNHIARTTIKETNIDNNFRSNVGVNTKGNVVYDPNHIARTTIKETNIDNNFRSNVGVNTKGNVVYDPNHIARTTIKETNIDNKRNGNINSQANKNYIRNKNKAKKTIKQSTMLKDSLGLASEIRNDGHTIKQVQVPGTQRMTTSVDYVGDANGPELGAYDVTGVEAKHTLKQDTSNIEYTGNAGNDGVNNVPMSYEDIYNAEIKAIRGTIDKGFTPGPNGPNKIVGGRDINATTHKLNETQNEYLVERGVQSDKVYNSIPQLTEVNITSRKDIAPNEPLADRINPEMISAFKENPYTQPLSSWA